MKKGITIITVIAFLVSTLSFSQIGIGTPDPDFSAQLDITSTTRGLLPPRMTFAQKTAIVAPRAGLIVFCTDCGPDGQIQVHNGTTWITYASYGAPKEPTSPIATAGNTQASVIFTAPSSDGGSTITSYTVTSSPDGISATGTSSPIVVTGLTNGTPYIFTVVATNAAGNSRPSVPSGPVTPYTVPDNPTIVSVKNRYDGALVYFLPPVFNGGSPITGYIVTVYPNDGRGTGTSSPIPVFSLAESTNYEYYVSATNAAGSSLPSGGYGLRQDPTAPDAPTSVSAVAGNAQATVSFIAPEYIGSSDITGYRILSSGGQTATGSTSPIVVSGLTNGFTYTFVVVAINGIGYSEASATSSPVTPYTM